MMAYDPIRETYESNCINGEWQTNKGSGRVRKSHHRHSRASKDHQRMLKTLGESLTYSLHGLKVSPHVLLSVHRVNSSSGGAWQEDTTFIRWSRPLSAMGQKALPVSWGDAMSRAWNLRRICTKNAKTEPHHEEMSSKPQRKDQPALCRNANVTHATTELRDGSRLRD